MSGFGRKFSGAMLISGAAEIVILDIFIQFTYEHFKIDTEKTARSSILTVIFAAAAIYPLAAVLLGRLFTRYFKAREYTLTVSRDISFFRNFIIIAAAVICADFIFLYERSKPFFDKAHVDAQMRIKILDLAPDNEAHRLFLLEQSYEELLDTVFYSVIAACVIQALILLLSARVLVKAYREQGSILLYK
jgi:hypothetical protein